MWVYSLASHTAKTLSNHLEMCETVQHICLQGVAYINPISIKIQSSAVCLDCCRDGKVLKSQKYVTRAPML